MGRLAWLAAAGVLLAGCGGGGGSPFNSKGPVDWGVPFVPLGVSQSMRINLRNIDTSPATVTLQGYKIDGTPYSGAIPVTIDPSDEHAVDIFEALGGNDPLGGFVLVHTPTQMVEAAFDVKDPGKDAEEASRAWPLGDLALPPPATTAGITITSQTDLVQLSNPTSAGITVFVTAYAEPFDPFLPPVASSPAPVALAPFETKYFEPDAISGVIAFHGALQLSSVSPFFVAGREDLAFDGTPPVHPADRILTAVVAFGQVTAVPLTYTDFAMILRNDDDSSHTFTLNAITYPDGTALKLSPRTVTLAAFESREISTQGLPFFDLFGDATLETFLTRVRIEMTVPEEINVTFRQFDPVFLLSNMTVVPHTATHVADTLGVDPSPLFNGPTRTTMSIVNPTFSPVVVTVESLVPQPDGFAAPPVALATFTIPVGGFVDFSPDGAIYTDRDGFIVDVVGFRFKSPSAFVVVGRREVVTPGGVVLRLSPVIVRNYDDAE